MNRIKYYSSIIIFCITWLIISELYVWHMENFQSEFPYVTFYRAQQYTQDEMAKDIKVAADKNSLKVFAVKQKINSFNTKSIIIYSTCDVETELKKSAYISAGNYNSIFLGNISVHYEKWDNIDRIDDFSEYHYIGNEKNATEFKKTLVDKYGGKFPQPGYITLNYKKNTVLIWGIAFSFLLLLSVYQIVLEKKALTICVLMGESIWHIVVKKSLTDLFVFLIAFFMSQSFIGIYGNTYSSNDISYWMFGGFIIINFLLYIPSLKINFKKNLLNSTNKGIFVFSYIYKILVMIIFIILAAKCIESIKTGADYYKQKDFFVKYQDYVYCKIELDDSNQTIAVRFDLYNEKMSEEKAMSLNQIVSYSNSNVYIYADSGAIPYLKEAFSELENFEFENKVYFLLPENANANDAKETWEAYYRGEYESQTIFYKSKVKIISTYRPKSINIDSSRKKNPIIILNNMRTADMEFMNPYLIDNTMYKITANEWVDFLEKNQIDKDLSCLTNIYENYQFTWKEKQRLLVLGIGIFILLSLLESIVVSSILQYEYQVNAMEIVLKKVIGYTFINRYKKMFFVTILGDIFGLLIVVFLFINSGSLVYSFVGGTVLCLLEMGIIVNKTLRMEKQHINKILKGGIM